MGIIQKFVRGDIVLLVVVGKGTGAARPRFHPEGGGGDPKDCKEGGQEGQGARKGAAQGQGGEEAEVHGGAAQPDDGPGGGRPLQIRQPGEAGCHGEAQQPLSEVAAVSVDPWRQRRLG